jgi:hypothetical protein
MINNDVANQLQLLIKAVAPPLIEVAETPLESPQWVPGQRLQAIVLSNLPNGRFQVLVSDHELDMNLPRNTQPGDKVDLTYISAKPRPTFVLTQDLPQLQAVPNEAKLSQAARFLGALLQGNAGGKDQAGAVARTAPLLPGPPTDAPELAHQLGKALAQSGLFYESHQAEWVAGQRPLTELLQEPQGKLSPRLTLPQGSLTDISQNLQEKLSPRLAQVQNLLTEISQASQGKSAPRLAQVQGLLTEISQGLQSKASAAQSPLAALAQNIQEKLLPRLAQVQNLLAELVQDTQGKSTARLTQVQNLVGAMVQDTLGKQPPGLAQAQNVASQAASSGLQNVATDIEKNLTAGVMVSERSPVHPQTTGLVQQQLEVLDGRNVVWQGQVWPGQTMEWKVEERDARREGSAPGDANEWQTTLRLMMPRLGVVNAALNLTSSGIQLKLTTDESTSVAAMKSRQEELRTSLDAAGVKLISFAVEMADG